MTGGGNSSYGQSRGGFQDRSGGYQNGSGNGYQNEVRKRDASEMSNINDSKRKRWDDSSSQGPPSSLMGRSVKPTNGYNSRPNGHSNGHSNDKSSKNQMTSVTPMRDR